MQSKRAIEYAQNRDKELARAREWRRKNPDHMRALKRAWRAKNPKKMRAINSNNRRTARRDFARRPAVMYRNLKTRFLKGGKYATRPVLFSREDFIAYCMGDVGYYVCFEKWKASGFVRALTPSVDRLDNNGVYSFDNIQIISLAENGAKRDICVVR